MTEFDVWTIYSGRTDTDAVVILNMEREMRDIRQTAAGVQNTNERLHEAIKAAGMRFENRYGEPARLVPMEEKS